MGVATVSRAYPEAHLTDYLNQKGRAVLESVARECGPQAQLKYPYGGLDALSVEPDVLDKPEITSFLRSISPLGLPGAPTAPVLFWHGTLDEVALVGPVRELRRKFCDAGATVEYVENPLAEHAVGAALMVPVAMGYLAGRFSGRPAPSNC
jgi:hypothetical protein